MTKDIQSASFRDPSGFLFYQNGLLYRQINLAYEKHYNQLIKSGLYDNLVKNNLLIPHEEINSLQTDSGYKIIKPLLIPFISYPYEWCFSQLKDAALATLTIQKKALEYNMALKDSSAYNIQFYRGQPILIDTLSFENYQEGEPWIAYKQFCQHFLAPLTLASFTDIRLNQLSRIFIDGLPLDLVSKLLPRRTYLKFSLLSHLHVHARSQKHFADKTIEKNIRKIKKSSLLALIGNLELTVKKLQWQNRNTEWGEYYSFTNYEKKSFNHKQQLISNFIDAIKPRSVWDLGANTGLFSRLASNKGINTVSFDIDYTAIEKNYLECKKNKEANILPLFINLTNPSPNLGWAHEERMSLVKRGPADMILALALIHHLAISNNLPFNKIAIFFSKICRSLIIEFVPKTDSKVQKLLLTRQDIFSDYNQTALESEFNKYFIVKNKIKIKNSDRTMYLMTRKK
jgi:hypothetical protein